VVQVVVAVVVLEAKQDKMASRTTPIHVDISTVVNTVAVLVVLAHSGTVLETVALVEFVLFGDQTVLIHQPTLTTLHRQVKE
jgi:hypothetical protein